MKIDRAFVSDIPGDPESAVLIQAIISMAKSLSLKVVDEGIEAIEQQAFLAQYGAGIGQGYFLGRPMPADKFGAHRF